MNDKVFIFSLLLCFIYYVILKYKFIFILYEEGSIEMLKVSYMEEMVGD